ncbi:transposon Tf2-11 polyprotein [Trichonephila clavipes]|nr:transposon Tf2-11 polyprotein [Trichonephila clavipes]
MEKLRDASKTTISCILKQQKPNGNQHLIAFHSRRLRNYEINYTITELECLAITDSLDKFHCYLHGSHFTVHTDHNALVWLKNFKIPTGRLFRWSLKVSMYDFDIKYKKGSTNVEADMLTRNPIAYHIINTPPEPLLDINEISHFQNIENTSAPKCFKRNGVFVVKRQGLTKIIVPKALRVKLMETTHKKFGHPGVATMLKFISPQYYWINIITDIRNYVKHCETCQINKKSHQRKYGLMQSLPLCEKPFELLSIYSVGGLNYYNSVKKYLHIIIDHATRYIWTFPSKNATTDTYRNCLRQIFQNHIPEKILSDRNTAFTSSKFKHFLKHNNITQLLTTSHRPQTNGKVERVNQTIITRLICESSNSSNKVPWTKILEKVTHQYNQTPHTITGFPPTYLMYGNLPFEISLKNNEIYPPLEEARKLAKERTEQYYKINKIRYDKKFQEADFKVGDLVMYEEFQYPNTRKLSPPYSGPYTVLRKCSDVLIEIDRPNALNKTDTELVHSVRLRHFHPSENFQLNYIQQNTHNNENKIITKRNILRNTEITEFCLTRLFGEKE